MELISLRIMFSIYSGWLTTATILNTVIALKGWGLNDEDMDINESMFTVAILITAECVYILASFQYKNPLYAAVFIWVLFAVREEQAAYENITTTTEVLLCVHGGWIIGLTTWLILDKLNNSPNEM